MAKAAIWLSYDLGLDGDYQSMYEFLDEYGAKECGGSIAFFKFEYKKNARTEIKTLLNKNVVIQPKDRVYLLSMTKGKFLGGFIFGSRKAPAWAGYHFTDDEEDNPTFLDL